MRLRDGAAGEAYIGKVAQGTGRAVRGVPGGFRFEGRGEYALYRRGEKWSVGLGEW